ncbi:hypothetical protein SAMN05216388_101752 [Halorientalis persicus]|uniref:Uncharacterized protein n=1 Tax=Halorientalis persicus TaxID=1367881 RepID=A0A1H8RVW2_9EURY|nr:hypothetical protein [Halorientalis persicus]SEO70456.1 hypothetical protein SAMN05216388_101752 [Halorientalis persicus]
MLFDSTSTHRLRTLTIKLIANPTLPALGYTKTVETIVAGGPTASWLGYSALITLLWVFADDIRDTVEEMADD